MYEKSPIKMEIGKEEMIKDLHSVNVDSNHTSTTAQESFNSLVVRTANLEINYVPRKEMESQIQKLLERFKEVEKRINTYEGLITNSANVTDENRQDFQTQFQQFINNIGRERSPTVNVDRSDEANEFESTHENKDVTVTQSWNESDEELMLKDLKKRKLVQEESHGKKKKKTEDSVPFEKTSIEASSLVSNIVDSLVNTSLPSPSKDKKTRESLDEKNAEENIRLVTDNDGENDTTKDIIKKDEGTNTESMNADVEKRDESTITEKEFVDVKRDESTNTEHLESKQTKDESTNTEPVVEISRKDESTNTEDNLVFMKTEANLRTGYEDGSNSAYEVKEEDEDTLEYPYYDESYTTEDDKKILADLAEFYYKMEDTSSTHVCKLCSKDVTNFEEVKSHIMGIHLYYIKC